MMVQRPDLSETVISLLERRVREAPDKPLVTFTDGATYTRAELLAGALQMADELVAAGARAGDRVAVMAGNRIEALQCVFACAHLGTIMVPVNTALRGDLLRHVFRVTEPALLCYEKDFAEELRVIDDVAQPQLRRIEWGAELDPRPGPVPAYRPSGAHGTDVLAVLFTSGTTGPSKAVGWTHQMALYDAVGSSVVLGYGPDDVIYTCLPMFHITALCTGFFSTLLTGGRLVVSPRFSAARFWPDLAEHGATATAIMGSMVSVLWRQDPVPEERQHRLRVALAIPWPSEYYAEFEERFNVRLTQMYGSTDTSIPIGIPYGQRRPGSCGIPLEDWECLVADENDLPVPAGEMGELLVRPRRPFVSQLGYWAMPEATVQAWRNLWFHTGDLFRSDEEGWLYYLGRNKDAIRKSGENVSAFEVEMAVAAFPGVLESAAFGVPAELGEEEVAVIVVEQDGVTVILDELRAFLEQRLPLFAVPRHAAVRAELPKTETQKIKKEQLRAEAITDDMVDLGSTSRSRLGRKD